MSETISISRSIYAPGLTFRETRSRTGDSVVEATETLQRGFYGVLATRPTASTGVIVLDTEEHGIEVSDLIDLHHETGTANLAVEVTAVSEEVITVDASAAIYNTTIPASIGLGMSVAARTEFEFDIPDLSTPMVLVFGLDFQGRSTVSTLPTRPYFCLTDDGTNFLVLQLSARNGLLWDIDSLDYSEAGLLEMFADSDLTYCGSGFVSNPSFETTATFRAFALLQSGS